MSEKTYMAVFFDVDLPALPHEARQIRLDRAKYINLMDEAIPDKTIELEDRYGIVGVYSILSRRVFHFKNSIDDTMFLICDMKKVK